jgi:SAM-dependent methyltransferase
MDDFRRANRANWDDRVPIHVDSPEYRYRDFIEDQLHISSVVAFDAERLGDVAGKTLLHLQCHFGTDTLSWARLGAEVTGVDFSEPALDAARRLSEESGVPGRFVLSELYESPKVVEERFDIVYTGVGAINWLPDIRRWAEVVAGFLRSGGTFYMREGHPLLWSLDWRDDRQLLLRFPYFETEDPVPWDDEATYAGEGTIRHTRTYEWNHGLGEIVTALLDAGLRLTALEEHRTLEWQGLPHMEEHGGRWRLPDGQADLAPLMYTLVAVKP